jgi:hypothetical protein
MPRGPRFFQAFSTRRGGGDLAASVNQNFFQHVSHGRLIVNDENFDFSGHRFLQGEISRDDGRDVTSSLHKTRLIGRPAAGRFITGILLKESAALSPWVSVKAVLLVEDNGNDAFMMRTACEHAGIPHLFKVVTDGDAAVQYLSGTGALQVDPIL